MNTDTYDQAVTNVRSWYKGSFAIANDLLVLNVSKNDIRQRRAVVSDYSWYDKPGVSYSSSQLAPPKYSSPTAQLSDELLSHCIPESVYDPQAS